MEPNSRKRPTLIRPGDGLVIAFFVPVVIMIIIFIQRGIFPFGDVCFLQADRQPEREKGMEH